MAIQRNIINIFSSVNTFVPRIKLLAIKIGTKSGTMRETIQAEVTLVYVKFFSPREVVSRCELDHYAKRPEAGILRFIIG